MWLSAKPENTQLINIILALEFIKDSKFSCISTKYLKQLYFLYFYVKKLCLYQYIKYLQLLPEVKEIKVVVLEITISSSCKIILQTIGKEILTT
jgi:hypothetical protein